MSRGIKVNIEEYIGKIKPFLESGCSLHEACLHGIVPYTTIKDYVDKDDEVRKNIERLQNIPILMARQSVNKFMQEDGDLALRFLERRKKDEFSTKHETEHSGNIGIKRVERVIVNSENTDSTSISSPSNSK